MAKRTSKMSEIMEEMAHILLRDPDSSSSEAAHVAVFFANAAWNECVGLDHERESYRNVWESIEAERPDLWNELKSDDIDAMIDELVDYKKKHYPNDMRRILTCGSTPHGTLRVEWLAPAEQGVDPRWEMELYGLVRTGEKRKAIRYLQETRGVSPAEATQRVARIAAQFRMKE
jgi:hypothetical protein